MDRGAWWATVHGLQRVGHNRGTEHMCLKRPTGDTLPQAGVIGLYHTSVVVEKVQWGRRKEIDHQWPCMAETDWLFNKLSSFPPGPLSDYISQPPLRLGHATCPSSGQWNMGRKVTYATFRLGLLNSSCASNLS